jgi:hypothetical protein
MRSAALVIAVAALVGCGDVRTGTDMPAPVYHESRDAVFAAAEYVMRTRIEHFDWADHDSYTVIGTQDHVPGGNTKIVVTMEAVTEGTRVNVDCEAGATSSPAWSKPGADCRLFLDALDDEMKARRQSLR